MKFAGTVLYVDDVPAVMDFYRRVFGLETRFYDEALQFAELETGSAPLMIASHQLGEMLMPVQYRRPEDGQPCGVEVAFMTSDVPAAFEGSRGGSRGSGRAQSHAVGSNGSLCPQHRGGTHRFEHSGRLVGKASIAHRKQ